MIEIWLYGRLVVTFASGVSVVLLLVALAAVTYLAGTLFGAVASATARGRRTAKRVGLVVTFGSLAAMLVGLRVGAAGSGGEPVDTALVAAGFAIAMGVVAACLQLALSTSLDPLGRRVETPAP